MADEGWWIDKRPGGAIAYTRPSTWAKTVEFNLENKGPLRMTSKKPGPDVTAHAEGGMVPRHHASKCLTCEDHFRGKR